MTRFNHQKRSGRARRPKLRERQPLGIGSDVYALLAHREMEYLRHPTRKRARKLDEARRAVRNERAAFLIAKLTPREGAAQTDSPLHGTQGKDKR